MSLQLKLNTITEIVPSSDRLVLSDLTIYGDTAPLRNTRANYIVGKYKSSKGDTSVKFENYDPLIVSEFKAIAEVDGWYSFNLLSFPIVATDADLTEGDVAYVSDSMEVRKKEGTVSKINLEDYANSSYSSISEDNLFIPNNSKMFNLLNRQVIDLRKSDVSGRNQREIARVEEILRTVDGVLTGSIYEYAKGDKLNAQKDIEFLNSNVDKYILH